ncbi:hypothetical protein EZ313_10870 [Ramlibacter henchirensis]|uniref:Uncharacterized protein n=1 Tax=Ramlibacter henchirensis TaxID=204072 RepID=A0A4Z0C9L1_9BURK|nr:hypothetical protein [Ramlibacter henchirensis]TFZ07090.1 hypothetical protein EZ313_10870 [Ramlibacter henchirensis]
MDRVTGPFDGYYVASSANEIGAGSGRYLGFAKVCCTRPGSFWLAALCEDPGCCAHLCGGGLFDTPDAALASAELLARNHIRGRIAGASTSGSPAGAQPSPYQTAAA